MPGSLSATNSATLPVLIVGAGPVGLTLAAELARRNVPFRLIDKSPVQCVESRAAAIWPRTLELFDALGVSAPMLAEGNQAGGLSVSAGDRELFRLSLASVDSPYPFVLVLSQSRTEHHLAERVGAMGVEIERGSELVALEPAADVVRARLRSADGSESEITASWIAGCDGAHSAVRRLLGVPFEGTPYQESFGLADVDVEWPLHDGFGHLYFTADGAIGLIPYDAKHYRLVFQLPPSFSRGEAEHGSTDSLSLEFVQKYIEERVPVRPLRFSNPRWLSAFRIHRRIVPNYRVGRVFLVGDAAHIHSPVGGQGMNTGIQDAINLGWKLALAIEQGIKPDSRLLDSYHLERHPVGSAIERGTDLATRVATLHHPLAQELRNRLASMVMGFASIQNKFATSASEIAVNYRPSNIVVSQAGSSPCRRLHSGDRVPDFVLETGSGQNPERLYHLLADPRHLVLCFPGNDDDNGRLEALAQALESRWPSQVRARAVLSRGELTNRNSPQTWLDRHGHAQERLGLDGPALVVIRPDGYLAGASRTLTLETVATYFSATLQVEN